MSGYRFFASCYDNLTCNVDYGQMADFLHGSLSSQGITGGLLLDIACGTGTLSMEMAKRGYEVIGIDASPDMLSTAQTKAWQNETNILFLCQEMQNLDLYGTVDAAICSLDSLNHITDTNTLAKTLERIHLFLNPGGIFIFDVNTPYKHREILGDNAFVFECGELFTVWRNEYDPSAEKVSIQLDFFREKGKLYERITESFEEKAYSDAALSALLSKTGFEILSRFDDYSHRLVTDATQRIVYLTKKRIE